MSQDEGSHSFIGISYLFIIFFSAQYVNGHRLLD